MFVFYFIEKVVRGVDEAVIWSQKYYLNGWQNFFDLFNSLPIVAIVFVAGLALKVRNVVLLAASMALHIAGDLPLHHDDGHRHFFPFSDWRFESPVSYWDPAHYGGVVGWFEAALVIVGCVWLVARYTSWFVRGLALFVLVAYGSYIGYALVVWIGLDWTEKTWSLQCACAPPDHQ